MKRMLALVWLGLVVAVRAGEEQAVKVGFEKVEGFEPGAVELSGPWKAEEGTKATIVTDEKASGEQSLWIGEGELAGTVSLEGANVLEQGVRFVDIAIRPVAVSSQGAEASLNAWGAAVGFLQAGNGKIQIAAVNGADGRSQAIKTGAAYDEKGAAQQWLRLTFRQDLKAKTWDLFVDGKLVATNLGFSEGQESLAVYGSVGAATYVDDVAVAKTNPLFADADVDGMPDAEELANGLNAYADDRTGDPDGDQVSNIEEMVAGTSPRFPEKATSLSGAVIYVDNLHGSDANAGSHSYPVGSDGPKASIKAAMAAAGNRDTIIVMPGCGVYEEGSRGAPDKQLTIRMMANVTIK